MNIGAVLATGITEMLTALKPSSVDWNVCAKVLKIETLNHQKENNHEIDETGKKDRNATPKQQIIKRHYWPLLQGTRHPSEKAHSQRTRTG